MTTASFTRRSSPRLPSSHFLSSRQCGTVNEAEGRIRKLEHKENAGGFSLLFYLLLCNLLHQTSPITHHIPFISFCLEVLSIVTLDLSYFYRGKTIQ
jgi:hypothetical protein